MDLSICIVNWNTCDLLRACLDSLYRTITRHSFEVIVLDNASTDGSTAMVAAEFPRARLIANRQNVGFAAGNNQALSAARGRYLMILNPDTEALPDGFDAMIDYLEAHPEVGLLSPKFIYPDGKPQNSCLSFPTLFTEFADLSGMARKHPKSPFWARYTMAGWAHDETREVDQPMGTCLLARREVIEQVGLLDERFPLYYNDVDWCRRIKHAGWKIVFLADTSLVHLRRASGDLLGLRRLVEHHRGKCRYFYKRYGWLGYPAYWLLNVVFIGGRWLRRRLGSLGKPAPPDLAQLNLILKVYFSADQLRADWRPPEGD